MSKTFKDAPGSKQNRSGPGRGRGRQRNISVRAVRRDPPDLRKLSRALIQLEHPYSLTFFGSVVRVSVSWWS